MVMSSLKSKRLQKTPTSTLVVLVVSCAFCSKVLASDNNAVNSTPSLAPDNQAQGPLLQFIKVAQVDIAAAVRGIPQKVTTKAMNIAGILEFAINFRSFLSCSTFATVKS